MMSCILVMEPCAGPRLNKGCFSPAAEQRLNLETHATTRSAAVNRATAALQVCHNASHAFVLDNGYSQYLHC